MQKRRRLRNRIRRWSISWAQQKRQQHVSGWSHFSHCAHVHWGFTSNVGASGTATPLRPVIPNFFSIGEHFAPLSPMKDTSSDHLELPSGFHAWMLWTRLSPCTTFKQRHPEGHIIRTSPMYFGSYGRTASQYHWHQLQCPWHHYSFWQHVPLKVLWSS